MKSIINMAHMRDNTKFNDTEIVLGYYVNRLQQIEMHSAMTNKKELLIESEMILTDTKLVLEFLTKQLKLSQTLNEKYSMFKYTELPVHGDPFDTIF